MPLLPPRPKAHEQRPTEVEEQTFPRPRNLCLLPLFKTNQPTKTTTQQHKNSPLYSDFAQSSEFEKAANLTRALEPIFFENSVDLVLTGHIHNWQRSCPAAKGGCVGAGVQAPVHVATPSAGEGERERWLEKARVRRATTEERELIIFFFLFSFFFSFNSHPTLSSLCVFSHFLTKNRLQGLLWALQDAARVGRERG